MAPEKTININLGGLGSGIAIAVMFFSLASCEARREEARYEYETQKLHQAR